MAGQKRVDGLKSGCGLDVIYQSGLCVSGSGQPVLGAGRISVDSFLTRRVTGRVRVDIIYVYIRLQPDTNPTRRHELIPLLNTTKLEIYKAKMGILEIKRMYKEKTK